MSRAPSNPICLLSDAELEAQIRMASLALQFSKTEAERREAWDELKRLQGLRTPEQVKRMEIRQGLRKPDA